MEGLRKQALAGFQQLHFLPAPHEHELITIPSPGASPTRIAQPLRQMLQTFNDDAYTPPTLRLVKLRIQHPALDRLAGPQTLNASQDDVTRLWSLFDLDPTALYLLTKGIRGFNQHRPLTYDPGAKTLHFTASSFTYCIVWTYRVAAGSASCVVVVRRADGSNRDFGLFWESLCTQVGIAHHPLCPFVALSMQAMEVLCRGILECQGEVASVERLTGFSPFQVTTGTLPLGDANGRPASGDQGLEKMTKFIAESRRPPRSSRTLREPAAQTAARGRLPLPGGLRKHPELHG